jgi:threonine dehydrogenase-like Zn-dependent dehydrogenase
MLALFWDGQELRLEGTYPSPKREAREALVRVLAAGICSTDLQILRGYMGYRGVIGHEVVGEVAAGPTDLVGRRVVAEINFTCRQCDFCARGLGRHCPRRRVMGILGADGSFAESIVVPVENLHPVPDGVSDEEAVFTEPLAAAFEILEQVDIQAGEDVLVLGDGKLGVLCAQVLRLRTERVRVIGKHSRKLEILGNLGIETMPLSDWRGSQADVVIEASGSPSGLKLALESVRPRGRLVLKSTVAGEHRVALAPLVVNEIAVIGSRCGPFPPALDALARKSVAVTPLIERVYSLSDGIEAVAHAGRSGALKVLLRPVT